MRKYLIKTDHGDVVVAVTDTEGLSPDLLAFELPSQDNTADLEMEVPLRAFSAKMVELIEMSGADLPGLSPRMREMMIREKAAEDLKRIERWARRQAGA